MQQTATHRLTLYFTPALLVGIACLQFVLATTQGLTPWKGGGFGMFSTVDTGQARFLRIYLLEDGQEIAVAMPETSRYRRLSMQLRHFPRRQSLEQLTRALSAERWLPVAFSSYGRPTPAAAAYGPVRYRAAYADELIPAAQVMPIDGVRVELWRYQFDEKASVLKARKFIESVQRTARVKTGSKSP